MGGSLHTAEATARSCCVCAPARTAGLESLYEVAWSRRRGGRAGAGVHRAYLDGRRPLPARRGAAAGQAPGHARLRGVRVVSINSTRTPTWRRSRPHGRRAAPLWPAWTHGAGRRHDGQAPIVKPTSGAPRVVPLGFADYAPSRWRSSTSVSGNSYQRARLRRSSAASTLITRSRALERLGYNFSSTGTA